MKYRVKYFKPLIGDHDWVDFQEIVDAPEDAEAIAEAHKIVARKNRTAKLRRQHPKRYQLDSVERIVQEPIEEKVEVVFSSR